MDILHHTLIGGAGYLVADAAGQPVVGAAFVAGSVLPDLDVAFMAFGKRAYLRMHQGPTHAIALAPLFALPVSYPLMMLLALDWSWPIYLGALTGLWLHQFLDWTNTFGIMLFYPFTRRRFRLDAIFFIDTVCWLLTATFYAAFLGAEMVGLAWAYPAAFAGYIIAKARLQRHVKRKLAATAAIPSAAVPWHFFVFHETDTATRSYRYDVLRGIRSREIEHPVAPSHIYEQARQSTVFREMEHIARALRVTHHESTPEGIKIEARDLAVRNFGGHFARTTVKLDATGKVVHEVAHI